MFASHAPPASAARPKLRSFAALYREEIDFVWTVLRRLGVEENLVEDAAHDVFVVIHRQRDRFEGRCAERTWVYAIARRIAWRYRRAEHRRARRRAALAAVGTPTAHLDDELLRREAGSLLAAFLETLDRPKREAFVLGELERLPRASLGRALGVSPSTAYSRLRAARADFAAAFGPEGPSAAVVRRRARTLDRLPSRRRHRLWLTLPGGTVSLAGSVPMGLAGALLLGAAAWPARPPPPVAEPPPVSARGESTPPPATAPAPVDRPRSNAPDPPIAATAPAEVRPTAPALVPPQSPRPVSTPPPPIPSASSSSVDPTDTLSEEAALMTEARIAMRSGDWSAAHDALMRHAARFPSGRLAEERQRSSVVVACQRGDRQGAWNHAMSLLARGPSPAERQTLTTSCIAARLGSSEAFVRSTPGGDQGK